MERIICDNCNKQIDTDTEELNDDGICEECMDFAEEWGDNTWLIDK